MTCSEFDDVFAIEVLELFKKFQFQTAKSVKYKLLVLGDSKLQIFLSSILAVQSTRDQGSISPIFYEQLLRTKIPKAQKTLMTWLSFCSFGICTQKSMLVKSTPDLFQTFLWIRQTFRSGVSNSEWLAGRIEKSEKNYLQIFI